MSARAKFCCEEHQDRLLLARPGKLSQCFNTLFPAIEFYCTAPNCEYVRTEPIFVEQLEAALFRASVQALGGAMAIETTREGAIRQVQVTTARFMVDEKKEMLP